MIYTIENEQLKVSVSDFGAELVSVYRKDRASECMWQPDVRYWDRQAPILFPVCGRFVDLKYYYEGKPYDMECHGFAWNTEFELGELTADSVTLVLTENDKTLKGYPFKFKYEVIYSLDGNVVKNEFRVTNTDSKKLYFSVGGHPGFSVPMAEGEEFEDYYVDFGKECHPEIIHGFNSGRDFEPYPVQDDRYIPLTHPLFDEDGVFLRSTSGFIAIRSRKSNRAVEVSYHGFPYVGIWHWPFTDAPYVCIEPWYTIPRSNGKVPNVETDVEMLTLEPNGTYTNFFDVKFI